MAIAAKKHGAPTPVKARPRGRNATRKKPLRERLWRAGVTYGEVAVLAKRSHRSVRAHIDGDIFSPAIHRAIEELAPAVAS
jgi:hypothetical protein